MTEASLSSPKDCLTRAAQFKDDGRDLLAISNQWYAVAYFYGAYHMVRAALMADPVFGELTRLNTFGKTLIPDDRQTSRHHGRIVAGQPRTPGVNDLVKMLYPHIAIDYEQLHSSSIAVRYGLGLGPYESAALVKDFDHIADAYVAGQLRAR